MTKQYKRPIVVDAPIIKMKESKNTEEMIKTIEVESELNQESRELLESYMRFHKIPTADQAILKIFEEVKCRTTQSQQAQALLQILRRKG